VKVSKLEWYARRLRRMSGREMGWRLSDYTRQRSWSRLQVGPGASGSGGGQAGVRPGELRFTATLPEGVLREVPEAARRATLASAEEILGGRWTVLGVPRPDIVEPDWFFDPITSRRAPQAEYCFRIDHRDEQVTGNIKQVWELSRLQHVTVLSAGFALSGDTRLAEEAERQLRSWWAENPFLSGVHWTSGIEVGLRLISWVWVRRLLDGWDGAPGLFEQCDQALAQIRWHQQFLAAFRSRGSSSNNHVIAEAAGQLVASLAFAWFPESPTWEAQAAQLLEEQLASNTFASGVNREMAFDYHGFVAELGLLAAAEARRAGRPVSARTWQTLGRMLDVVAAVADVRVRAPRQGDSDDGHALLLGPPGANRWESLLATGRAVFGAKDWWPEADPDTASILVSSLAGRHPLPGRSDVRPGHFADAGLTIMRSSPSDGEEIWCRCDAGPHGFLSIAAHAHADALSIEVRHGGTDIFADPGTYCYNSQPRWRDYFRSTLGHNTLELDRQDQSTSGGPTMWTRHAQARLLDLQESDDGRVVRWSAEHDGYDGLNPGARHRRTVALSSADHRIDIRDRVESAGRHRIRLAFHLGPDVRAVLDGREVQLAWGQAADGSAAATLQLSPRLQWTLIRGSTDPVLGWYSRGFGEKEPTTTVLGEGTTDGNEEFETVLSFA
jgi:Heparinase II/III-like protein/Heparinase II/III N-terminus